MDNEEQVNAFFLKLRKGLFIQMKDPEKVGEEHKNCSAIACAILVTSGKVKM